jgi:hypothetical protein
LEKEKAKEIAREEERRKDKAEAAALIAAMKEDYKKQLEEESKKFAAREAEKTKELEIHAVKEKEYKEQLDHYQRTVAMDVVLGNLLFLLLSLAYCCFLVLLFADFKLSDTESPSHVSTESSHSFVDSPPVATITTEPTVSVGLPNTDISAKGNREFVLFMFPLWFFSFSNVPFTRSSTGSEESQICRG